MNDTHSNNGTLFTSKKYLMLYITVFITLFITVVGFSISWFKAKFVTTGNTSVIVNAANLGRLIFHNGDAVEGDKVYPGWCETKRVSVEAIDSTVENDYEIRLNVITNTLVTYGLNEGYITYSISVVDSLTDDSSYYPVIDNTGEHNITITSGYDILTRQTIGPDGSIHTFDIEFCFPETGSKQDNQQKQVFNATIDIVEYPRVRDVAIDDYPGVLEGTGTESDPYLINCIEDLVAFGIDVDGGNLYTGEFVKMPRSYDFKQRTSYADPDRTDFGDINGNGNVEALIVEMTTGAGFNPIGTSSNKFGGTFDGNNKILANLRVNRPTANYGGLFAFTNLATIKDYKIINANISGKGYVGILAGSVDGDTNSSANNISNIEVDGKVHGTSYYTAGVVGRLRYSKVSNIKSTVDVETTGVDAGTYSIFSGGMFGQVTSSTVASSSSSGSMFNNRELCNQAKVGGLIGYSIDSNIIESSSSVLVNSKCGFDVGGLVGYVTVSSGNAIIDRSFSTSTVINEGSLLDNTSCTNGDCGYTGGFAGRIASSGSYTINVYSSYSTGNVTSTSLGYAGGFLGVTDQSGVNIQSSYSSGNVVFSNNHFFGGFIGVLSQGSTITKSYSTGNVSCLTNSNSTFTAGFVGLSRGTISKSYSLGNVISTNISKSGGFIGRCAVCTLSDVYAGGNVSGLDKLGHVMGIYTDSNDVEAAVPSSITSTQGLYNTNQVITGALNTNTDSYGAAVTPSQTVFQTTLALTNNFAFYADKYPLLYALNNSHSVTANLMDGQVERSF